MKHTWKIWAVLPVSFALCVAAQAQTDLILPRSQADIRELTQPEATGPCLRCGVLTNVRPERRGRNQAQAVSSVPDSGVGESVATTPLIGSGTTVKDARNATKPDTFYKMTVRYDDGTYAFFEQDEQPEMKAGDRVEVIEGRLQPRID